MSSSNFYNLDPERVLSSAEMLGFVPTGEMVQLNSYENRVFSLKLESRHSHGGIEDQIVGKFYRPGRWTREAILDEHLFTQELLEEGLTCVPPIRVDGETVFENGDLYFTFFPKTPGRLPQEMRLPDLKAVGRLLAQLHNVGARCEAKYRLFMDDDFYGCWSTLDDLQNWIAPEVLSRYNDAAESIIEKYLQLVVDLNFLRIHGDCHRGNLLHNGDDFFFIDFDDFVNGPAVQDFWMLLSWDETMEREKECLLEGYHILRTFDPAEWEVVDLLRGIRIIGYAGWIAARWEDPTFRKLFPDYESYKYWAEEAEALEKIAWKI